MANRVYRMSARWEGKRRLLAGTFGALRREALAAARLGHDTRSSVLLCSDVFVYRLLRLLPSVASERTRCVLLSGDVPVHYRRNRGDLHALREVWLDEAYRLPFDLRPRTVVDLGANIGLTSLWLRGRYEVDRIVAVEPSTDNVRVLRKNLPHACVTVIHAAVGPEDGIACFATSAQSHLGRVASVGSRVRQVSMHTVLDALAPATTIDLLKVDIEGAETQLFSGDLTWLTRVRSIVIEIHPPIVDRTAIIHRIQDHGFRYLPAGSVWPDSMDAFIRADRRHPVGAPCSS